MRRSSSNRVGHWRPRSEGGADSAKGREGQGPRRCGRRLVVPWGRGGHWPCPHLEGVLFAEVHELVLARVRVVRPPPSRNLGQGKGGKVDPAMSIVFLKMFEEAANALVGIRV